MSWPLLPKTGVYPRLLLSDNLSPTACGHIATRARELICRRARRAIETLDFPSHSEFLEDLKDLDII